MFRSYGKAALIAAVAASCGYAGAATLTIITPTADVSKEGAGAATTAALSIGADVNLAMGSFQARDNVIRLSLGGIAGAKFAPTATSGVSVSCTTGNIVLDVPTVAAGGSSTIDFGITGTSGTTSSAICTFRSLSVLASSLSLGGTLTLSSAVKRVSDTDFVYDPASAVTAMTVSTQVSSVTVLSALNGVVDYAAQAGLGFATDDLGSGDGAGKGDVLSFVIGSKEGMTLSSATALTFTFSINAAAGKTFGWLDDAPGGATTRVLNRSTSSGRLYATAGGTALTSTISTEMNLITITGSAVMTGTQRTVQVEFQHKSATPSTGLAIESMTFPDASVKIDNGARSSLGTTALTGIGSWTTNGTTVKIPYMPINTTPGASKLDPIIVIGNRSSTVGTVTVTAINARGQSCSGSLGTIDGNSTKSFGGLPLRNVLNACTGYNIAAGESLSISLVATLASDTTDVFTGYNADTGRVTVVNSTNGR
jgi:hypothetical protein